MPPKKQNPKDAGKGGAALGDTDLEGVSALPLLNDLVFITLYSFKYRQNQLTMEHALMNEFDLSHLANDPETAEQAKRNRVIQMADLMDRAKGCGYLTADEAADLDHVDSKKLVQVLARCTNEILVSIQVPFRREKALQVADYESMLEKAESPSEKESIKLSFKEKQNDAELMVWLKDFPKTQADFKEMRRSASQHMPEIDIAVHAALMIEEQFVEEQEEEDTGVVGANQSDADLDDVSVNDQDEAKSQAAESQKGEGDEPAKKKKSKAHLQKFSKDERTATYRDLLHINKYAHNCPLNSQMRMFHPKRLKFVGPDPPPEDPEPVEDPNAAPESAPKDSKKKGKQEEAVEKVEVPRTEEQQKADKLFAKFIKQMRKEIDNVANDLSEYRQLTMGNNAIEKVPLWPKILTETEIEEMRKTEESRMQAEEEKLAAEQAQAETAAKDSKPASKGKGAPKGGKEEKPASRAGSAMERPSTSQSRKETMDKFIKDTASKSQDEDPKNFNFNHFERVVNEMSSKDTSVGSILAAMVYQVEKQNEPIHLQDQETEAMKVHCDVQADLLEDIEQVFMKTAMESAVVETDWKHTFDEGNKVGTKGLFNANSSPYQQVLNQNDSIHIRSDKYRFMNGKSQAVYEESFLNALQLPGINERFKMPATAERDVAERKADTGLILRNCNGLVTSQAERMIVLKEFQDLLKANNTERDYNFMDRNYQEFLDPATFRQILADQIRLDPDVNTQYFDKEDALLLALNFKNPQGRLLRRQWTAPLKTVPSFQDWRRQRDDINIPAKCINIPTQNMGLVKQNTKYCFPYDNSVIRVKKNQIGSRRFGTSVVLKDNLKFGIKEPQKVIDEKVPCQDEILSSEARKTVDTRCEFWLEFENGVRMHSEMVDQVKSKSELIPPMDNGATSQSVMKEPIKQVQIDEDANPTERMDEDERNKTNYSEKSRNKSSLRVSQERKSLGDSKEVGFNDNDVSNPDDAASVARVPTAAAGGAVTDDYIVNRGASLTFTYNEGLTIQVLPDGSVRQTIVGNKKENKKQPMVAQDLGDEVEELSRTMTRQKVVIKEMKDGNQVILFPDGAMTYTDHRRAIWKTINAKGVVRERNLRKQQVCDQAIRLETTQKVDPETQAVITIREDGWLKIDYADKSYLIIFPDQTETYVHKLPHEKEESRTETCTITKDGYSPFKVTYDPLKAKSGTIIGLGGADALMGRDGIMERSNGGLLSELFLPDRTIVQTYFEKQELPGVNRFSSSMIHLVRRPEYSTIKVRQDGEVVVISANARAFLNEIGKQLEFGTKDYDYFFELFGTPNERRSGVYTCNLDKGRMWTQDEEGNFFIVYANGDSTEKLSVSFNLDQMLEGIENKEPSSPRIQDGEYIDNECKFLPPPKTVGHPRLFLVKSDGAYEYSNFQQLEYMLRCEQLDKDCRKEHNQVRYMNEDCTSHIFMREAKTVDPAAPDTLTEDDIPQLPAALEMVNQTVSIAGEPDKVRYLKRQIIEFKENSDEDIQSFYHALSMKTGLRDQQEKDRQNMTVKPRQLDDNALINQTKLMLRIAKARGIDCKSLIDEEYKPVKKLDADQKRETTFAKLDQCFTSDRQGESTEDSA